ncbi:MAG: hypothetical protein C0501_26765 [Isosphaera sp.]|nr:hypothetical protein [Isosphaera sp.]
MRRAVLVVFLTAGVAPAADPAPVIRPGKPADHGVKDADLDALRALLKKAVDDKAVPGVGLLVAVDGAVIFREAFGDLKVDQACRIASSTKPVTATAVMVQVDRGKLALDDPISKHLPEFKGTKVEKATVRQLLSHTGGVGGAYPGGRPTTGTMAAFGELVAKKGTLRDPGAFAYSGVSMDLAGRVAEAAAGEPFEQLVKKTVWEPLGMTGASFTLAADPKSVKDGESRWVSGGGGMSATLDDLAAFLQMHLNGGRYGDKTVLSEKAAREMRTHQPGATNPRREGGAWPFGSDYGLGFYLAGKADAGYAVASHGGALGTMPWLDADRRLVAVYFTQVLLPRTAPTLAQVQKKVAEIVPVVKK